MTKTKKMRCIYYNKNNFFIVVLEMISEGNSRASYVTQTQEQARLKARDLAIKNQSEVLLHGVNGKIRAKDSYANDPYPPRG